MKNGKYARAYIYMTCAAVCFIIIFILIIRMFAVNSISKTDFGDMKNSVITVAKLQNVIKDGDAQMVRRLYGIDPSEYEGVYLEYPETNMGADELLIVKLKSTSQQKKVSNAIKKRNAEQLKNFDGYGTDQYGLLKKQLTEIRGNYVLYVVAKDTTDIKKAFEKKL